METNRYIAAPHLYSAGCFSWNFKALGLIWKNIPLIQILMSAFTQSNSFSRTGYNVDCFWSLTLSTDLVYSHLLPPSQSLFSSLPHVAIAGGFWSWDNVLPPCLPTTERQLVCSPTHAGQECSPPTCLSKVCCKFFRDKNLLLLLKNAFVSFFFSSFSNFFSSYRAF